MKRNAVLRMMAGVMISGLGAAGVQPAQGQIHIGIAPNPAPAPANVQGAQVDNNGPTKLAADASNQFAFDLFAKLRTDNIGMTNLFFAPYSIDSALAMTRLGARGTTADEFSAALHLPADSQAISDSFGALNKSLVGDPVTQGFTLSVANALWGQKGEPFLPGYLDVVNKDFGAAVEPVDFVTNSEPSRKQINDWIADKTHDKIKDLLPKGSVTPQTRLVLTNAVYFKGDWTEAFEVSQTAPADFRTRHGDVVKAELMHKTDHLLYGEDDLCQAVELPYKGDQLSMLVFLPKPIKDSPAERSDGTIDPLKAGFSRLEAAFDATYLQKVRGQLGMRKVNLAFPNWQATQSFSLAPTLAELGIKRAFTSDADFSGIDGRTDLYLSGVVHKAFVNVDEKGTEAAGATGVVVGALAIRIEPPPVEFTADHAFLYLIIDRPSGTVLFTGRLCDPTAKD